MSKLVSLRGGRRHGSSSPVWISPARELMAKDLAVAAYLQRLKTVASPPVPPFGRQESINALAERFVSGLQIGCPSAVHTILATASKLKVLWPLMTHHAHPGSRSNVGAFSYM